MELSGKKTTSQALLGCGNGGGLTEKLLLQPRAPRSPLQTQRVPRSSVLDRLQAFLPRMAEANQKLQEQMEQAPAGHFDIECVDEAGRAIEMDVALVELSGSESDLGGEEETSTSEEESDWDEERSGREQKLRLPGATDGKRKANIQVVAQRGEP